MAPEFPIALRYALGASLALHLLAGYIAAHSMKNRPIGVVRPQILEARLRPPMKVPEDARLISRPAHPPAAGVLKDTRSPNVRRPPRPASRPPSTALGQTGEKTTPRRVSDTLTEPELTATLSRLSRVLLYPAEAVEQGWEGEVIVLIEIGADGGIADASVASSSRHPILDSAALRAVRLLGSLGPGAAGKSFLLPVRFRLE